MTRVTRVHRGAQRGSALLIVFVFAAILAITLYAEMPVVAFEAKREKEQLLIDRGHEYAHAVKLYVRKFGSYPPTIKALEDTNRMRFLRQEYKDPFTGKNDWRLLHAGPGGMLVDSKVNPLGQQNQNPAAVLGQGLNPSFGSTSTASTATANTASSQGSFGSSSFGSSSFGSSSFGSSDSNAEAVVVPSVRQRPPAVSANASASETGSATTDTDNAAPAVPPAENEQSPATPLVTPGQTDQMAGNANEPSSQPGNTPSGQNAQAATPAPATGTGSPVPFSNRPLQTLLPGSGSNGAILGASGLGIAGVASIAKGHTIKTVNDQNDYSLWEFYYDPSKDSVRGAPGQGISGQQGTTPNGVNTGAQQNQSIFGQNSTSSFGQSSSFGQNSGFGQNSNTQSTSATSSSNTSNSTNPPQQ